MPASPVLDQEREGPPSFSRQVRDLDPPEGGRSRFWLWFAIFVLTCGLLAGGAYWQSRLAGHDGLFSQLKGWPAALELVRQQVAAAEQKLSALPGQFQSLSARLNGLEARLAAGLDRAQKSTRDLGVSLRNQMGSEVASARRDARDQAAALHARIGELESQRQAEAARAAQLEQEVARLNARLSGIDSGVETLRGASARESNDLREEVRRTAARVAEVANFNNRERTRFEAARGTTQEISPGFRLHITRTDPRYRRFDGWLQLVNDQGRFLWLRDQSMLQTIAFYAGENTLRHDLVITDLTSRGVVGYVIFPRKGEWQGAELSRSSHVN